MAYREFTDQQGRQWRVWNTQPRVGASLPATWAGGWLCFENDEEKRRLLEVPEGWEHAPEDRLYLMLRAAEIVVPKDAAGEGARTAALLSD